MREVALFHQSDWSCVGFGVQIVRVLLRAHLLYLKVLLQKLSSAFELLDALQLWKSKGTSVFALTLNSFSVLFARKQIYVTNF